MDVRIYLLLVFCTFSLAEETHKVTNTTTNDTSSISPSTIIEEELERFDKFRKSLNNVNATIRFSETITDKNGTVKEINKFGIQPLELKGHVSDEDFPKIIPQEEISNILKLARRLNLSVVYSREEYNEDGGLARKQTSHDGLDIILEHGNGSMILYNNGKHTMKDFDAFVKTLQDYELPSEVEKILYNEEGEQILADKSAYTPRRVTIEKSANMSIDVQMTIAESVKRTFSLKEDGNDRAKLLVKFLQIKYPEFKWQAVIGRGNHFLQQDQWVRVIFDNETCTVFGKKIPTDDGDDDDDDDDDDYDFEYEDD